MIRWLPAVLFLVPRWLASIGTAFLLLATLLFFGWLLMQKNFVTGRVAAVAPSGSATTLEIRNPVAPYLLGGASPERRLVRLPDAASAELPPRNALWVLALGHSLDSGAKPATLVSEKILFIERSPHLQQLVASVLDASTGPLLALALAGLILIGGPLFARIPSALFLGLLLGFASWHGLHIARFIGAISLPDPVVSTAALWMALVGLLIGARARADLVSNLVERVVMLVLLALVLPVIAEHFGLPVQGTTATVVLLTIVFPLLSYTVLGGFCLTLGLQASSMASPFIMLGALLVVVTLHAGRGRSSPRQRQRVGGLPGREIERAPTLPSPEMAHQGAEKQ
jgi:hypothetical protein